MIRNLSKDRFNVVHYLLWFIAFTLGFLFFFVSNSSAVTQVSLQWDPNTETDLAGYRIFSREQSQSYDYTAPVWEGTDTFCTIYNLDETKTYCFVARAFDTSGLESQNSAEVCNSPTAITNQPPTANAGPDQTVSEGQIVTLNGSNSTDPDDGIASYQWVQTGGPAVTLSDPAMEKPTFTAPDVGQSGAALTFELTVTDQGGNQSKDVCTVNVTWQNEPPQANAGSDQTVNEESVVNLDGSKSLDIDDAIASYLWTQTGGPSVTLSDPTLVNPSFTAPTVGTGGASLTFELTVTDEGGLSNTDSCVVNITWQNQPPTAVVNPDFMDATEGTSVTLNGSASTDSDDGISSYQWTQVEGDPVSLANASSSEASFTAPQGGSLGKNLKFKLTVKDKGGLQGTADSSVYVMPDQISTNPPAADFSYTVGKKVVTFKDHSTDSGGTIVSWLWDFGDGQTSTMQNPNHRYIKFVNYTVTLTVTDNNGGTDSTSATVTVTN
jgi:PKD repeat protein